MYASGAWVYTALLSRLHYLNAASLPMDLLSSAVSCRFLRMLPACVRSFTLVFGMPQRHRHRVFLLVVLHLFRGYFLPCLLYLLLHSFRAFLSSSLPRSLPSVSPCGSSFIAFFMSFFRRLSPLPPSFPLLASFNTTSLQRSRIPSSCLN